MTIDKDGYIVLTRKNKTEKVKKEKKHWPSFKKSSWKYWLFQRLKHHHFSSQFKNPENLLIHDGEADDEVQDKHIEDDIKRYKKMLKKDPDAYIMVNAGNKVFMKVSLKSYIKLLEIKDMVIDFSLLTSWDGLEDEEVYHQEYLIDSVNELCRFINFHRMGIEGVYDLQSNYCLAFNETTYKMKILVRKIDKTVETYKSDMNDFMKKYGLYLF